MLVSAEWLRDYVQWDSDPKTLQQLLNNRVSEIETVQSFGLEKNYEKIVVGQVIETVFNEECYLAKVNIGHTVIEVPVSYEVTLHKKYAVALPDANLPIDQKFQEWMKTRPIETVMFCRERDLGFSDNETLLTFSEDVEVGTTVYKALNLNDIVFHFDLEPHRPDLFSMMGFAREIAALHNTRISLPRTAELNWTHELESPQLSLKIDAPEVVNRYSAVKLKNIHVKSSPQWIQNRLTHVGLRPRNNIVDITNYVMLECGQPLHAFDYSQINGQTITLRRANANEKFTTLDGKERTLDEDVLLVADLENPVAIAGIIGGENSSITENTTEILLESANFNMTSVRRTSRLHAIRTDASLRFEKGPDANQVKEALERAVLLLQEYADAEVEGNVIDYYPQKTEPVKLTIDLAKINDYLGSRITNEQAENILHGLEFKTERTDSENLSVTIPTFRPDVKIFEDLVEELGRIYGYDNIPYTLPPVAINPVIGDPLSVWQNFCKSQLINSGFSEVRTDPWMGDDDLTVLGLDSEKLLEVQNFISVSQKYLRISPFPALLNVVGENLKKHDHFKIFELSKTYERQTDPQLKKSSPASEKYYLAGAVTLGRKNFNEGEEYYTLKAALNYLFSGGNIDHVQFRLPEQEFTDLLKAHCGSDLFETGAALEIVVSEQTVGLIGYISKSVANKFGIKATTAVFFLSFDRLLEYFKPWLRYIEPSKMPSVQFDIDLLVDNHILVGDLQRTMKEEFGPTLVSLKTIDIYQNTGIKGKKSVTFSLKFNSPDHSLRKEQIQESLDRVIVHLANEFGAELRSS